MNRTLATALLACLVCSCGSGCRKKEPGAARGAPGNVAAVSSTPAVLATVPEAPETSADDVATGHSRTLDRDREVFFSERGGGVAFVVESGEDFQVVHNAIAGKPYAAVGSVALSPDGRRVAHGALVGGKWRMVVDGKEGAEFSTVKLPTFSPDGSHVAYQAMAGELWHLVVDEKVNGGTRTRYLQHEFGAGSSRLVFIADADDGDRGKLLVSDLAFEKETVVEERASSMVLSPDRTRVAAIVEEDGGQRVAAFAVERPDRVDRGPRYDAVHGLAVGAESTSLAYVAERGGETFVVLGDREEPLPPGFMFIGEPVIRPDGKAVGALVAAVGWGVGLRQFFAGVRQAGDPHEEAEGLVYSGDGRSHAYAARRGAKWFVVADGREGPPFDRVVSPQFSPDGKHLVYRARQDGKRFVVVQARGDGTARRHEEYDQVFPVLFTEDGESIAYGVKDGRQLAWKVEPP